MKFSDAWLDRVSAGKIRGARIIHKVAAAVVQSGNYAIISASGGYPTPTVGEFLEVVSTSTEDGPSGTGALTIQLNGIGEDWTGQSEILTLNGTTPVTTVNKYLRMSRTRVMTSGSYASPSVPSHAGVITTQGLGGGTIWSVIEIYDNLATGVSLTGGFTVPKGFTAHIIETHFGSSDNKELSIAIRVREGADIVTAPFSPTRIYKLYRSRGTSTTIKEKGLGIEIHGPADIGLLARSETGTINLECSMDILLLDNKT